MSTLRRMAEALRAAPRVTWSLTTALVTQSMEYRADYLLNFGMSLLPTLMLTFVWWSIEGARGPDRWDLLAYFLAVLLLEQLTNSDDFQWRLARRIQSGDVELEALVGNPLSTVWFGTALGIRAGQFLAKSPGLVLLGAGLLLAGAWQSIGHLGYAVLAICGAFVVRFLLSVTVSALTFWIDDVAGIYFSIQLAASVLSGRLIPLDRLGAPVESVLAMTPFYYTVFAPATVLAGSVPAHPVLVGQLVWTVLLLATAWALTRAGLRRYANVAA